VVATFYVIVPDIPEKVRLLAVTTCTRRAGRAALVEAEAIWAASLDANTRVEAIVSEGGVVLEDRKMARKRLTRKDDGVETACVREEERGGKRGRKNEVVSLWNGSSAWSGQQPQAPRQAISLANGFSQEAFYVPTPPEQGQCGSDNPAAARKDGKILSRDCTALAWLSRGCVWRWSGNLGSGRAPSLTQLG